MFYGIVGENKPAIYRYFMIQRFKRKIHIGIINLEDAAKFT